MKERSWERLGAASGIGMVVTGAAAEVFERAPSTAAEFVLHRTAVLTQSMIFLAGSAFALWFLGSLRAHLRRYEGGTGRVSAIAFGAGLVWVTINLLAQAFQVGLADDPTGTAPYAVIRIAVAVFTVANLPLAIALLAVAVVSLRHHAFPRWLGWVSIVAALAQGVLWLATVVDHGPLASDGWLSFALYPFFVIWLVPASVIMIMRPSGSTESSGPAKSSGPLTSAPAAVPAGRDRS